MSQLAAFRGDDELDTRENSPEFNAVELTRLATSFSITGTKLGDCIDFSSRSKTGTL